MGIGSGNGWLGNVSGEENLGYHVITLSRTEREPDKTSLECHGHRPGVCVCVSCACCVSVYVRAVQRSECVCVRVHVCVVRAYDGAGHAHPCSARRAHRKIGPRARYAASVHDTPAARHPPFPTRPRDTVDMHGRWRNNPWRPGTHCRRTPPLTPLSLIPPPSPRSSRSAAPATGPARRTARSRTPARSGSRPG